MPYCITIAGDIQHSFTKLSSAQVTIQELRDQGSKPRLYYSTSFERLGCEIDDDGTAIPDMTTMSWCEFMLVIHQASCPWSATFDELSGDGFTFVEVFSEVAGRTHLLAELTYVTGQSMTNTIQVNTGLLRVMQGLMAAGDL